MKILSRLVLLLAGLVLGTTVLCANGATESEGLGSLDEPTTITFWGWPTADAAIESIIKDFEAVYPNITVDVIMNTGTNENRDALTTAIAAGTGAPDVTMIEVKDIDKFVLYGGLQDLLEKPFNAGRYQKDFIEYKWDQGTNMDGSSLLAFPWDIGPASVFYRRDIFEQAGLPSDPESVAAMLSDWEGFLSTGRKVQDAVDGVWFMDNASTIPYIYYSHKNFFDEDLNLNIDNPKTREVLGYAAQAREEGLDAQMSAWTDEWYQGLANGTVATTIAGCWFGSFLKGWIAADAVGEWGIVPVPEDPLQNWGGSFLAIPEQSEKKLAAWAFIEFVCANADAQNTVFESVDFFPAYIPAYGADFYDEGDPYFGGQKTRALWAEIAQSQGEFVTTPLDAAAEAAFMAEMSNFLNQGLSVDEAIRNMERAIENQVGDDRELLLDLIK